MEKKYRIIMMSIKKLCQHTNRRCHAKMWDFLMEMVGFNNGFTDTFTWYFLAFQIVSLCRMFYSYKKLLFFCFVSENKLHSSVFIIIIYFVSIWNFNLKFCFDIDICIQLRQNSSDFSFFVVFYLEFHMREKIASSTRQQSERRHRRKKERKNRKCNQTFRWCYCVSLLLYGAVKRITIELIVLRKTSTTSRLGIE